MNKKVLTGLAVAFLAAALPAHADHWNKYFPLKKGNSWTHQNMTLGGTSSFTVGQKTSWYSRLDNFPGAGETLRVDFAGGTLFAWNADLGAWRSFLRFAAPAGTEYNVNLSGGFLDNLAKIKVVNKNAKTENSLLNTTFNSCVVFSFLYESLYDAGVGGHTFAPNVGLVRYSSQSIMGPWEHVLRSAVLDGKKLGLVSFEALESGAGSQYTAGGTNKVLLFNNKTTWKNFYNKHKPGAAVPAVNFYKHTMLVALAGNRGSYGHSVKSVKWNYPSSTATVKIEEFVPPAGSLMPVGLRHYQVVRLDEKVYNVKVDWKVSLFYSFTSLESGNFTSYPTTTPKQVLVIGDATAWTNFYKKHNPGTAAPSVDFNTKTVLVVLAGHRSSSGFSVKVQTVESGASSSSAKVVVQETQPTGIVLWVITNPYQIVVVDAKFANVTVDWQVTQYPLLGESAGANP